MSYPDFTIPAVQSLHSGSSSSSMDRLQQISARASSGKEMTDKEIQEVGQQFEAMLVQQLLSAMRKSIPQSGLFEESSASDMYKDMFDEKIAEQVAATSETGIAQTISQSIKQQQEQIDPSSIATRMLPLEQSGAAYLPLNQDGKSWKSLDREASAYYPIPDKKRGYMPITSNEVSAKKVSIVG